MIAGIDYARGDGIVCMDADLQHPPECLLEIVEKFDQGYEVISMVRMKNKTAGLVKNITSAAFYKLINHLSDVKFEPNASDFFAVSKGAADVLRNNYREKVRFLRGYVQSVGFNRTTIQYEARPRFAGESKYSLRSLFRFSINTILCFSDMPLKLGIYSGGAVAVFGILMMAYTIWTWAKYGTPSGYATIVVLMSLHVRHAVCDRGDHWGVHCDPVFRAEGPPDLHRKEHRKHGIRRESYEILNNL